MNLYEQYALLKSKMTELENKEAELRTQILEEMVAKGEEKIETSIGSFKKATLKKWSYTDKVAELEEDFKARKALEQSTGEATYIEQSSLRYTPIKL